MKSLFIFLLGLSLSIPGFSQVKLATPITKEQQLNEEYCSGLFSTSEATYIDMLNDASAKSAPGYLNVLDWLNGRVAGLAVYRTRTNEFIPYIRNGRAGIFVDEIQVSPSYLGSLAITDIAMIKIIKGPFAGGFNSPGGAIAIYTVKGDEE